MSQFDQLLLVCVHISTLASALLGAACAALAAWRTFKTGKKVDGVSQAINGGLKALLAESENAGYLRGLAEARQRWGPKG